jgi:hypothetical protein
MHFLIKNNNKWPTFLNVHHLKQFQIAVLTPHHLFFMSEVREVVVGSIQAWGEHFVNNDLHMNLQALPLL